MPRLYQIRRARGQLGLTGLCLVLLLLTVGLLAVEPKGKFTLAMWGQGAATDDGGSPGPQLPYDLILGLASHKTGTAQMECMLFASADAAGLPLPMYQNAEVRVENITAYLTHLEASSPVQRPAVLYTGHPLASSHCYARNGSEGWVLCPNRGPCACQGAACAGTVDILGMDNCFMSLPAMNLGLLHFVRNPIDIVISAYLYHSQLPVPEDWLNTEAVPYREILARQGVDGAVLEALGMSTPNATYAGVLRGLSDKKGSELEFWRSLPELYEMARQYRALRANPAAVQVRFEDLAGAFNATARHVIAALYRPHPQQALFDTMHSMEYKCDPGGWDEARFAHPIVAPHITSRRLPPAAKAQLAAHLMGDAVIRGHLCTLLRDLPYQDERCDPLPAREGGGGMPPALP